MTDKLRSSLIRLAASNPELRSELLPLLKEANRFDPKSPQFQAEWEIRNLAEAARKGLNSLYLACLRILRSSPFGEEGTSKLKLLGNNTKRSMEMLEDGVEIFVMRREDGDPKTAAEKTAGLSKAQILTLAKDALGNEKLAKIVVSVLTKPAAWKFTKNWDEQTWKGALQNNAKNYEGLAGLTSDE